MATTTERNSSQPNETLDVSVLKDLGKKGLVDALNSINGAKTLVLDPLLAGPLGLVTEVALLKHHGVDKMFWLETGPLTSTTSNIMYLCRPLIKYIKIIADQIKRHTRESQKYNYTLLLVPRTSTITTRILEEEGVLGDVTILPYNLQFIPLAEDVISLENDSAFKEIWVDGDETVIYDAAQAFGTFQKIYGNFPRIVGKGDYAGRLAKLLTRHSAQAASTTPDTLMSSPKIDCLILLDRRVDMITPLLTQLTYEGLIDELLGIKNSHVELPLSLLSPPAQPSTSASTSAPSTTIPVVSLRKENKKKHHLTTSTDPLFAELRDLNFASVGKRLNKVAHRLDQDYKARHQAKTVAQLRDFVGKLGGLQTEHQSLRLHTGLLELLTPMTRTEDFNKSLEIQQNLLALYNVNAQIAGIEEMIARGADMQTVVRLLCLASITAGGIKAKVLEGIKRDLLQAYGYDLLPMLLSLASPPLAIMLPTPLSNPSTALTAASKHPFSAIRKSLRLLIDDNAEAMDEVENDISYVYSGYAPISVRLVQCVAQKGGVLTNPATIDRDRRPGSEEGDRTVGGTATTGKVQAHPIVGWKGFDDILASMPGDVFDIVQGGMPSASVSYGVSPHEQTTTTVVFFLGGCTHTEIAAIRWVGRQNRGRNFLIATTGMISGGAMIDSLSGAGKLMGGTREAGL